MGSRSWVTQLTPARFFLARYRDAICPTLKHIRSLKMLLENNQRLTGTKTATERAAFSCEPLIKGLSFKILMNAADSAKLNALIAVSPDTIQLIFVK